MLCYTLAKNTCDLLTITANMAQTQDSAQPVNENYAQTRKTIVIFARQHPGETPGSFMMEGVIDFLTDPNNPQAQFLRENFIFQIIPMLNPDGVIHGNYRCSLAGVDLNRVWDNPSQEYHETVYYTKQMIYKILQEKEISYIIDLHGHSQKMSSFFYGNPQEGEDEKSKIFPLVASSLNNQISFQESRFSLSADKNSTARQTLFQELGNQFIYTFQSSFYGGTFFDPKLMVSEQRHFTISDFQKLGSDLCRSIYQITKAQRDLLDEQMRINQSNSTTGSLNNNSRNESRSNINKGIKGQYQNSFKKDDLIKQRSKLLLEKLGLKSELLTQETGASDGSDSNPQEDVLTQQELQSLDQKKLKRNSKNSNNNNMSFSTQQNFFSEYRCNCQKKGITGHSSACLTGDQRIGGDKRNNEGNGSSQNQEGTKKNILPKNTQETQTDSIQNFQRISQLILLSINEDPNSALYNKHDSHFSHNYVQNQFRPRMNNFSLFERANNPIIRSHPKAFHSQSSCSPIKPIRESLYTKNHTDIKQKLHLFQKEPSTQYQTIFSQGVNRASEDMGHRKSQISKDLLIQSKLCPVSKHTSNNNNINKEALTTQPDGFKDNKSNQFNSTALGFNGSGNGFQINIKPGGGLSDDVLQITGHHYSQILKSNAFLDQKFCNNKPRMRGNILISDNFSQTIITFCDNSFTNIQRVQKLINLNGEEIEFENYNNNNNNYNQQSFENPSMLMGISNLLSSNSPKHVQDSLMVKKLQPFLKNPQVIMPQGKQLSSNITIFQTKNSQDLTTPEDLNRLTQIQNLNATALQNQSVVSNINNIPHQTSHNYHKSNSTNLNRNSLHVVNNQIGMNASNAPNTNQSTAVINSNNQTQERVQTGEASSNKLGNDIISRQRSSASSNINSTGISINNNNTNVLTNSVLENKMSNFKVNTRYRNIQSTNVQRNLQQRIPDIDNQKLVVKNSLGNIEANRSLYSSSSQIHNSHEAIDGNELQSKYLDQGGKTNQNVQAAPQQNLKINIKTITHANISLYGENDLTQSSKNMEPTQDYNPLIDKYELKQDLETFTEQIMYLINQQEQRNQVGQRNQNYFSTNNEYSIESQQIIKPEISTAVEKQQFNLQNIRTSSAKSNIQRDYQGRQQLPMMVEGSTANANQNSIGSNSNLNKEIQKASRREQSSLKKREQKNQQFKFKNSSPFNQRTNDKTQLQLNKSKN